MADLAPRPWGIPVVRSTSERNTLFAAPKTDQRVQNLETGDIERFDGSQWTPDIGSSVPIDSTADAVINTVTVGRGTGNDLLSTAIGASALAAQTSGSQNTAVGNSALLKNTTGATQTAIGIGALQENTTGTQNTAVGAFALLSNTTGTDQTAIGVSALRHATTGVGNTAIGGGALTNLTDGSNNIAIGSRAMNTQLSSVSGVAIGVEAMFGGILDDQIVDGTFQASSAGLNANWTGGTGWTFVTGAARKNANGTGTLTPSTAYIDFAPGSGYTIHYTIANLTAGTVTVSFGGVSDTVRSTNGTFTFSVTPTTYPSTLTFTPSNTSRFDITSVTFEGTQWAVTDSCTAIGTGAGYMFQTCDNCTAVGVGALRQHGSGDACTAIGVEAAASNGSGLQTTALGAFAFHDGNAVSGGIAIGYAAGYHEVQSNRLIIDNQLRADTATEQANAIVYGTLDPSAANQRLRFNATVGIGKAATSTSPLCLSGLPTSSAGLASGDVWLNSNVLTIVP